MSVPTLSLSGRTALVTGGKKGIGKGIALAFAGAGADVAICSRTIEDGQLEAVAGEIRKKGRRGLAIQADVSRKTDVDRMVAKVIAEFGSIDILVNNAAVTIRSSIVDLAESQWDEIMGTDLKGYFLCAQAVSRKMVERRQGCIINVVARGAFAVLPTLGAYCVAKAGAVMLTKVLARELGPYGIRANGLAPGIVRTELAQDRFNDPAYLKQRTAMVPLARLAEVDDMVGAALFLASDASSYITGDTILVEGGAQT